MFVGTSDDKSCVRVGELTCKDRAIDGRDIGAKAGETVGIDGDIGYRIPPELACAVGATGGKGDEAAKTGIETDTGAEAGLAAVTGIEAGLEG